MSEVSMSNKTDFYFWLDKQPKIKEKRKSVDQKFNAQVRAESAKKQAKKIAVDTMYKQPIRLLLGVLSSPFGCGIPTGGRSSVNEAPRDGGKKPDIGLRSDIALLDRHILDSRHADSKPDFKKNRFSKT